MTRGEVHNRLLASIGKVNMGHLTRRELDARDWDAIARTRTAIAELPISIDDRSAVTTTDIRSHARTIARRGPLAAVIVDYLQLMTTARGDKRPRHEVVTEMSRDLKILAKDLGVPVITLSQLNRASEARTDRRPTMADLRESGSLEQDSNVVLLLHVEESDETTMHVAVAKNRQGATGGFQLIRRGPLRPPRQGPMEPVHSRVNPMHTHQPNPTPRSEPVTTPAKWTAPRDGGYHGVEKPPEAKPPTTPATAAGVRAQTAPPDDVVARAQALYTAALDSKPGKGEWPTDALVEAVCAIPELVAEAQHLRAALAPVIDYVTEKSYTTFFGDCHATDVRLVMRDLGWAAAERDAARRNLDATSARYVAADARAGRYLRVIEDAGLVDLLEDHDREDI